MEVARITTQCNYVHLHYTHLLTEKLAEIGSLSRQEKSPFCRRGRRALTNYQRVGGVKLTMCNRINSVGKTSESGSVWLARQFRLTLTKLTEMRRNIKLSSTLCLD